MAASAHSSGGFKEAECPSHTECCGPAVPLYDSLGESAVEYTVNHSETSIIFAEASKLEFLAKAAKAIKKNVKHVVYWGSHASADGNSASIKDEASLLPIGYV